MILLENEEKLWESKNKQLLLTTHRLREMRKIFMGSKINSIMLEELSSCELRTKMDFSFLKRALIYFLLINGAVYLINHYLLKAEIIKLFFGEVHIGAESAGIIFYLSLVITAAYIATFFLFIKKVLSFHSVGLTIDFQLRWLDFEERENFISKVEDAKDKRQRSIYHK